MRILTLDAAGARCAVGLVDDGGVRECCAMRPRGQSAVLAPMVRAALDGRLPDLVGVTVGPGSFTGLRAALSLAQGLGLAGDLPVIAVGIGEALCASLAGQLPARRLWVALASRPGTVVGRVFIDQTGTGVFHGCDLDALPAVGGPVAVTGDAAIAVAVRLAARDDDVALTGVRHPSAAAIAAIARRRHVGALMPLALRPLYVDPPMATPVA